MTLIELLIVIVIMGIMGGIATPFFFDMIQSARYRDGARTLASVLRDARSQAVATNQRHQVVFNLDDRSVDLQRENAGIWEQRKSFGPLAATIDLRGGQNDACIADSGTMGIIFSPNGSATFSSTHPSAPLRYVCIFDQNGQRRLRVGIPSPMTGRVALQRPSGTTAWQ